MPDDLPLARRDVIAARLAEGRSVSSGQLAAEFGVSEDAIRRDLRALAAEGRCRRVYGGALPLPPSFRTLSGRLGEDAEAKRSLAAAAATLVERGELLFVDAGSTHLMLIDALPEDFDLTVATNAPHVAAAVLRRPDIGLVMIGGTVDPAIGGAVDATALEALSRLRPDHAFIGVCGLTPQDIGALHPADAAFKRAAITASGAAHVLLASAKIGARAPHVIAPLAALRTIIVDRDAPKAAVDDIAATGLSILRAATPD